MARGEEKTTEAQRAQRGGAASASVPSVPLWFKSLEKKRGFVRASRSFSLREAIGISIVCDCPDKIRR